MINDIHFEFIAEEHKSLELKYVLGGVKISELIAKKQEILDDGAFIAQAGALTEKFQELNWIKFESPEPTWRSSNNEDLFYFLRYGLITFCQII